MIPTNVVPFPEIQSDTHFGSCPLCGNNDGYVNLGKEHWFICREHKKKWYAGSNLFEEWKDQTVSHTLKVQALLESYTDASPHIEQELKRVNTNS